MTTNSEAMPTRRVIALARRSLLIGASAAAILACVPQSFAADVSGDLVLLNWASGYEAGNDQGARRRLHEGLPGRHLQGDQPDDPGRSARRHPRGAAGGEKADLFVNTWPAFRKELADAGHAARPRSAVGQRQDRRQPLATAWKDLGSTDGTLYGITYTFGDRSAMFYKTATHEEGRHRLPSRRPGTNSSPTSTSSRRPASTPIAIGAKVWSHAEWFEVDLRAPERRRDGRRSSPPTRFRGPIRR